MAGKGQGNFVGGNAAAVIHHSHQAATALRNFNVNSFSTSVNGVFHQFLHHRRRPLNHLTGGNFGRHFRL